MLFTPRRTTLLLPLMVLQLGTFGSAVQALSPLSTSAWTKALSVAADTCSENDRSTESLTWKTWRCCRSRDNVEKDLSWAFLMALDVALRNVAGWRGDTED